MLPADWLHVNGVSLSPDIHQQAPHTSDYRTKHVASPNPQSTSPLVSSPNSLPFTATMIDGHQINRPYYQKLENTDLPKKLFIDRQIKRVKALPGLIKGTALSRHLSLHSAPNGNDIESNPSTNNNSNHHANSVGTIDTDNESSPSRQHQEQTSEARRPRVSFSDFHKIQFYEDTNDNSQPFTQRRHRHRSLRKVSAYIGNNYVSPPSIQHSQALPNNYPLPYRQQPMPQDFNIKKQPLFPSPRGYSSRVTHFPDIPNPLLQTEAPIHEKYPYQSEKDSMRLPEPTHDIPISISNEASRESTRAGAVRASILQEYHDQNNKLDIGDTGLNSLYINSSMSSSITSRQRPLRTISLRQQFSPPAKSKPTTITNNNANLQIVANPRRSASLKQASARLNSIDDDHEEIQHNGLIATIEHRPVTGVNSSRPLKADYIIHFNAKNPTNGHQTMESLDRNRYNVKSNFYESSQERFHNVLKVVRPPFIAGVTSSNHDTKLPPSVNNNSTNGNVRSSQTNNGPESHDFHIRQNTIFV